MTLDSSMGLAGSLGQPTLRRRQAGRFAVACAVILLAGCQSGTAVEEQADDAPPAEVAAIESGPSKVDETSLPMSPGPASGPLLTRISSEDSGMVHQNFLPRELQARFLHAGAGVAAGDYDGDGLPDIYLVSEAGNNRLYRNLGNWQFEDVTAAAGVEIEREVAVDRWTRRFPTGALFFDADDDGWLDLYVTAFAGAATLFHNNGDGTFTDVTAESGVGYVGASTTACAADYDLDGHLDLYVATYRPYAESKFVPPKSRGPEPELQYDLRETVEGFEILPEHDVLYRNRGDGTFEDVTTSAGITGPGFALACAFADVTGNGLPDLFVANDLLTPDAFYENMGDGTFRPLPAAAYRHSPWFSMGLDFGDIDNDGWIDFMGSDMLSPNRARRQTQSHQMGSVTVRESPPPDAAAQVMRNILLKNNGDGTFSDVAPFAGVTATDWTWTVKFVDVDLDGFQDILVTNGFTVDDMNADEYEVIQRLRGEGRVDEVNERILTRPRLLTANIAFRNLGGMRFEEVGAQWGFNDDAISHGLALADLDGDGDLDAITNNMNAPVGIYRNDATANRVKVALRGSVSNHFGVGARLTLESQAGMQTREMAVSGGYMSGHEPVVVFGLGESTSAGPLVVDWPSGHRSVVETVGANRFVTITEPEGAPPARILPSRPDPVFEDVAASSGASVLHTERVFDDFGAQPLLPMRLSQFGPGLAFGDADGDGRDDLYVTGGGRAPGTLLLNEGGSFRSLPGPDVPEGLEEQGALWLPHRTGADLIVSYSHVEAGSPGPHVIARQFPVTASGVGQPAWEATSSSSGGALAAADYDGDGYVDLFVAGRLIPDAWPLPASSRLFRGSPSGLIEADNDAPLADVGMVTAALWSDVNGDGRPDLLLAREYGPIMLLLNDGGRLIDATASSGLADHSGLWSGLAAGDVNHDGHMDLVAANMGLNTRFQASPDAPLVTLAGDLDGDGDIDIVETEWDAGLLYPWRNRIEMSYDLPATWSAFDSWRAYALAPVEEVLGPDAMALSSHFEATRLAHTLFINDGAGRFEASQLPDEAQLMPGYGVVIEDLDGDGHDDIYMAGNNYGPEEMHTGPFDAGVSVWLRNKGDGTFAAVPVRESGLSVPADAKGVAAADFDGDGRVDLAVGVNKGALRLFRNKAGSESVMVRLVGDPGNPAAIGARVAVTRADGLVMTREVRAGGSFLSSSSMTMIFGVAGSSAPVDVNVTWPDGTGESRPGVVPGPDVLVLQKAGS